MTRYLIYIAIHLMLLLASIGINALAVAFPQITTDFNTSLVLAGWVLSIYLMVSTVSSVLVGKVADILGNKRTFFICAALFISGSVLSAIAPNIYLLIFFRFIQSIGAGGFVPVILGIVSTLFPRSRARAIGFSISIYNIGGIIGPNIGAWLVSSWGWRAIFWFNVPIGILVCLPLFFLLAKDTGHKSKIDYIGAGLLAGSLFSVMIGLSQINSKTGAINWPLMALLMAVGAGCIWLFIRHVRKTEDPVISLDILSLRPFAAANFFNFLFGFGYLSISAFIPLFAVSVYGLTTLQSSFVLTAYSLALILTTMISSLLFTFWGYHRPLLFGIIIVGLCYIIAGLEPGITIMAGQIHGLPMLIGLGVVMAIGIGLTQPASSNACLDLMPERIPTIAGVRSMFTRSGGTIGIALVTLLVQFMGNNTLGFTVAFITVGVICLSGIPFIFAMPDRPLVHK